MNLANYITLILLFGFLTISAQESVDGAFAFETDPAKKYSIYVPSSYDENTPNTLMLGFHPLNTNRWDGEAWRDTLIQFAETNNLLMVCPDGGPDGRVDDPIDLAFTTALLDSMSVWYNVDQDQKYIIGFSWGGRTTYKYGLANPDQFEGYVVIGAAVDGTLQINNVLQNASFEKFFLVHGSNDSPSVRFDPLVAALNAEEACVATNLMPGIGHTIDFPNRNAILTDAFNWVADKENCGSATSTSTTFAGTNQIKLVQNPIVAGTNFTLDLEIDKTISSVLLYDFSGKVLKEYAGNAQKQFDTSGISGGQYVVKVLFEDNTFGQAKLIIQ